MGQFWSKKRRTGSLSVVDVVYVGSDNKKGVDWRLRTLAWRDFVDVSEIVPFGTEPEIRND